MKGRRTEISITLEISIQVDINVPCSVQVCTFWRFEWVLLIKGYQASALVMFKQCLVDTSFLY